MGWAISVLKPLVDRVAREVLQAQPDEVRLPGVSLPPKLPCMRPSNCVRLRAVSGQVRPFIVKCLQDIQSSQSIDASLEATLPPLPHPTSAAPRLAVSTTARARTLTHARRRARTHHGAHTMRIRTERSWSARMQHAVSLEFDSVVAVRPAGLGNRLAHVISAASLGSCRARSQRLRRSCSDCEPCLPTTFFANCLNRLGTRRRSALLGWHRCWLSRERRTLTRRATCASSP